MKSKFKYMALLLLLPFVHSCIFDEVAPTVEEERNPVMVTFTLDVMSSAATKADDYTWGGEYPTVDADNFENKILTSDLMVIAYDTAGNFVAELPVILCTENNDGQVEFTCAFDVDLPEDASSANPPQYRFVVLANCLSQGYGLSYNGDAPQIADLKYTIPTISSWKAIPMWGVRTHKFTYTGDNVDDNQDLGTVDVLRATAKVGVKLSQELKSQGYELGELKINKVGGYGYSVPNGWNASAETKVLAHTGCFRPGDVIINNVNTFVTSTDGAKYIYVPETDNSTESPICVSLVLNKKVDGNIVETLTFDYANGLQFCNYNNGTPTDDIYDIVRNHYYEYTIDKIVSGKGLALTLNVMPWGVLEESIKFTDEVTISAPMTWTGTYLIPGTTDKSILYIDGSYSVANAVTASFKIDTPVGATWYASFEGDKDAFSFIIETTADDTDKLDETTQRTENGVTSTVYWKKASSVTGYVGDAAVLRVVTNSQFVSENKSVSLRIVVITLDGRTITVNKSLMPENLSGNDYYQLRQNLSL